MQITNLIETDTRTLEEKLKAMPKRDQFYIQGLVDGALIHRVNSTTTQQTKEESCAYLSSSA